MGVGRDLIKKSCGQLEAALGIDGVANGGANRLELVAQNLCRDELRRRRRDPRVEEKPNSERDILYDIPAPPQRFSPQGRRIFQGRPARHRPRKW